MDAAVRLRPFVQDDVDFLHQIDNDPEALGDFEWFGFHQPRDIRKRWEKDRFLSARSSALAVTLGDGPAIGIVSWRTVNRGGPDGTCLEVGAALLPEHRGRGLGTRAQQCLVDYLWSYTTAHRLEALTDADNAAEQRALEKIGFEREGLLRDACWRDGDWRDLVMYGLRRK